MHWIYERDEPRRQGESLIQGELNLFLISLGLAVTIQSVQLDKSNQTRINTWMWCGARRTWSDPFCSLNFARSINRIISKSRTLSPSCSPVSRSLFTFWSLHCTNLICSTTHPAVSVSNRWLKQEIRRTSFYNKRFSHSSSSSFFSIIYTADVLGESN